MEESFFVRLRVFLERMNLPPWFTIDKALQILMEDDDDSVFGLEFLKAVRLVKKSVVAKRAMTIVLYRTEAS